MYSNLMLCVLTLCHMCVGRAYSVSRTEEVSTPTNITGPKDMYVVRATVYQVGILTNKTDETENVHNGQQETITFYRHNGSSIDVNNLPAPLVTNVTAENVVGVAPIGENSSLPWTALKIPSGMQGIEETDDKNISRAKREMTKTPAKITKGAAVIPSEAGVQSIALPPLISLNKNLSEIPVPIPNVSVVSYAKVNTLVHSP